MASVAIPAGQQLARQGFTTFSETTKEPPGSLLNCIDGPYRHILAGYYSNTIRY